MSPEDRRILDSFAARVRELEPRARIWAFGSRARGDAAIESDLDVCVVVPELTPALRRGIRAAAWEVGFEHERVLATVVASAEDFDHGRLCATTLVKTIHDEGIAA
jgi:predicted nucleotidyltransferase